MCSNVLARVKKYVSVGLSENNRSRRAVVSCEAKKQHVCAYSGLRDHYSELFTQMAGSKF